MEAKELNNATEKELLKMLIGGQFQIHRRLSHIEYMLRKIEMKIDGKSVDEMEKLEYDSELLYYMQKARDNSNHIDKYLKEKN